MPEEKEHTASKVDYQDLGIEELVGILKADVKNGLSAADIGKRVNNYGYNEIPEEKANPYISFAKKFWDPTAWMLEAVICTLPDPGNYPDVYIIVALLLLNAVLGFFQEQRASGAVDTLKQKLRVNARTLRDGKWQMIPARDLYLVILSE